MRLIFFLLLWRIEFNSFLKNCPSRKSISRSFEKMVADFNFLLSFKSWRILVGLVNWRLPLCKSPIVLDSFMWPNLSNDEMGPSQWKISLGFQWIGDVHCLLGIKITKTTYTITRWPALLLTCVNWSSSLIYSSLIFHQRVLKIWL